MGNDQNVPLQHLVLKNSFSTTDVKKRIASTTG